MAGLIGLASLAYGGYVLIRIIIAFAKGQEKTPWILKLGVALCLVVVAAVMTDSQDPAATKTDSTASTASVQQKTPEDSEKERKVQEEQAALQKQEQERQAAQERARTQKERDKNREKAKRKGLTMEQFNKIKMDMTYQQCVQILGKEGELVSESEYNKTYVWETEENNHLAIITLAFFEGRVSGKHQTGLK